MTSGLSPLGICILTETFHPLTGGGETQARALAEGLSAAGDQVCLITRRHDRALAARERIDDYDVHRVAPAGRGHLLKWGMVFSAFLALVRLRKRYDVILVCGFRILGIPARLAEVLFGRPCVLKADSQGEFSGAFFDAGLARLRMRHDRFPASLVVRLRNALLRRAARFVSIASVIEREYMAGGVPADRIARIPNSVDTGRFRPIDDSDKPALRSRLGLPADRRIATFTGRLVTTKGLPSLLRAWRHIVGTFPDAVLVLVGSGGLGIQNCEADLRRFVAENGLDENVRFAGSVNNVEDYLQAADIFVFPSEREAFGISVIEAMACGVPVVTTNVDGIGDVVRANVDALVVDPGNDEALAEAIGQAFRGGPEISTMTRSARERVLQRYTSQSVVAAYRNLLVEASRR